MARVLVVDDEEDSGSSCELSSENTGTTSRSRRARRWPSSASTDSVRTSCSADVRMPGMSGIELCKEIGARGSSACVIVMSAYGSVDLAIQATHAGAYDFVTKPFKQDEVLLALRKAEERESLRRENRALREVCTPIAASPACSARAR